jgi:hypothetical protein
MHAALLLDACARREQGRRCATSKSAFASFLGLCSCLRLQSTRFPVQKYQSHERRGR